jgi:transposase
MMMVRSGIRVHIALGVTDMRKGLDGLAMLVQEVLKQDPFSGHLFAFRGRKANLIKIVFWDGILDVEGDECPGCGGRLHPIGEATSEMLDWVPAQLRVVRIRRPKYGCRACGTIHQAPAPERPIAKGLATPGLIVHVLVSKYCDHTPLYRQAQIFARHGARIERSTLASWVGGACWWLGPLQARLAAHVFASTKLFADDTPIPVLDPGRGRTRTARLWVYARDDRPWAGPDPPAVVYFYSPDRRAERPASHLESWL